MHRIFIVTFGAALFLVTALSVSDAPQLLLGAAARGFSSLVASPFLALGELVSGESSREAIDRLTLENAALTAELARLRGGEPSGRSGMVRASVYSTYPFNHRDFITIGVGASDGIAVGMGVVVAGEFFLGAVHEVFPRSSAVQTIFDTEMSIPVKLGAAGADALLVGGRTPRLTLITSDEEVFPGDRVYAADASLPYGLSVGTVGTVTVAPGSAFQEALLSLPYDPGTLDAVFVVAL